MNLCIFVQFLISAVKFRKMCPKFQSQAVLHLAHHRRPPILHPRAPPPHLHQTTMTTTAAINRRTRASGRETFIRCLRRRRRLSWQNRSPLRNGVGNLCPLMWRNFSRTRALAKSWRRPKIQIFQGQSRSPFTLQASPSWGFIGARRGIRCPGRTGALWPKVGP